MQYFPILRKKVRWANGPAGRSGHLSSSTYKFAHDNGGLVITAPEIQSSGLLEFIDLQDQTTWSPPCSMPGRDFVRITLKGVF